jgi:signal transduction histidine kinase
VPSSTVTRRLSALSTLAHIPTPQLEWLADHGSLRRYADGAVLYGPDVDLRAVFVVLSGRISVRMKDAGVEREIREVRPGEISGYLPYSRIVRARAFLIADGPVEIWAVPEADVREMTRACYDFTAACVHAMIDRVRTFKHDDLQREKMAALGRLSAGLAHELDNPSSAMVRTANALEVSRKVVAATSRVLGEARLTGERRHALEALEAAAAREPAEPLSPVAQADRELRLLEWLECHDLAPDAAPSLAGTGVGLADLEAAAAVLAREELSAAVQCVAAEANARQLTKDIVVTATRVHTLVGAVKAHTHMDRPSVPEPVALPGHLEDTMSLLASKALARDVSIALTVAPELPPVRGVVSELNHVWLNLIDNAIDAAPRSGHVTVSARADEGRVMIEVIDDGPGIEPDDLGRIFDPFFTTKDVGQGTGLGLDVVRTVVRSHGGSVDVTSRPGCTALRVMLPAAGAGDATRAG